MIGTVELIGGMAVQHRPPPSIPGSHHRSVVEPEVQRGAKVEIPVAPPIPPSLLTQSGADTAGCPQRRMKMAAREACRGCARSNQEHAAPDMTLGAASGLLSL